MGGYSPESSAKVSGGGVGSVGRNKGAPKGDIEGQIPKALKPQGKAKAKANRFSWVSRRPSTAIFCFWFPSWHQTGFVGF